MSRSVPKITTPTLFCLEVEGHALHAVLEFDRLAGLNIVETVNAGDAVADRQHLTDLAHLGFIAEISDLILEDRRNFCGADIHHQPTSFIRVRIELSLVFKEASTMREPSLTMMPPMIEASVFTLRLTVLPPVVAARACRSAAS